MKIAPNHRSLQPYSYEKLPRNTIFNIEISRKFSENAIFWSSTERILWYLFFFSNNSSTAATETFLAHLGGFGPYIVRFQSAFQAQEITRKMEKSSGCSAMFLLGSIARIGGKLNISMFVLSGIKNHIFWEFSKILDVENFGFSGVFCNSRVIETCDWVQKIPWDFPLKFTYVWIAEKSSSVAKSRIFPIQLCDKKWDKNFKFS